MSGHRGDDDRVRTLLDRRAQRADVPSPHTHYSIFSDRSDSPSLYSHFDTSYRSSPTTPVPQVPLFHDPNAFNDRYAPYSPHPPLQHFADPSAPSTDLSEHVDAYPDSRPSISHLPEEDLNNTSDSDEDEDTRLSLMGPQMRVHSRAPWEEEENDLSDNDVDNSGSDTLGGKKAGRNVMRGLGFGSKSPVPKPSIEIGKRSFETASSVSLSSSRNAIQALAQASMSSTSLALGPSPSSSKLPHKLSVGRLALTRSRVSSTSGSPDKNSAPPSAISAYSTVSYGHSGRVSPTSYSRRSISPHHSTFSGPTERVRSPSPISTESEGGYTHPYANPALLSTYHRGSIIDPFGKDNLQVMNDRRPLSRNDSLTTLSASEETVILSQSSSSITTSTMSISESDTPPTSSFSLVSSNSQFPDDVSLRKLQPLKVRKDAKLGPISTPTMIESTEFSTRPTYTLISLEQAQAREKERSRSVTMPETVLFPRDIAEGDHIAKDPSWRTRASSTTSRPKQSLTINTTTDNRMLLDGTLYSPTSGTGSKQSSPLPPGKTLRPKRSGFMKLFNGRDKDRETQPPPVPPISGVLLQQSSDTTTVPITPKPLKSQSHRVPVPSIDTDDAPISPKRMDMGNTKKGGPSLSIKVSSPPASYISQEPVSRRSDSPKSSSLMPVSPKMPTSAPAGTTHFAALKLRPVSSFFSNTFSDHLLSEDIPGSPRADTSSLISPTTAASSELIPSPVNMTFNIGGPSSISQFDQFADIEKEDPINMIPALKEQIRSTRKAWQRQIWDLEAQVRDLKIELEDLKAGEKCEVCGRGIPQPEKKMTVAGVLHRPRAKTGSGGRFASGIDA